MKYKLDYSENYFRVNFITKHLGKYPEACFKFEFFLVFSLLVGFELKQWIYDLTWPYDLDHYTKMKFSMKDLSSKCDQIRRFLRIWSHLLEKSLMENLIFRAVDDSMFSVNVLGTYILAHEEKKWSYFSSCY